MTVVSPCVMDGNRVMTLLNGQPAAAIIQTLICIQIHNLSKCACVFVNVFVV